MTRYARMAVLCVYTGLMMGTGIFFAGTFTTGGYQWVEFWMRSFALIR